MRRRRLFVLGCAILPVLALAAFLELMIWPAPFSMGNGSPTYAKKWKARLDELPDPESARAKYDEIVVKRYGNNEWIFGVSANSHSSIDGGTIVVRDSRGDIHAFFRHVCGDSRALQMGFDSARSLDGFYHSEWFEQFGFTEYQVP
jgi:hypothetical protein